MQGGVENYLAQNDSNNEYKWMLQDTLPYQQWNDIALNTITSLPTFILME